MSAEQPQAAPGGGITSSEFLDSSMQWAIHHLEDARRHLKEGEGKEFHAAIRKFANCTNAMLDTVPEVKL